MLLRRAASGRESPTQDVFHPRLCPPLDYGTSMADLAKPSMYVLLTATRTLGVEARVHPFSNLVPQRHQCLLL